MRRVIRTIRGDLDPAVVGFTLMHEHVICDITPPQLRDRADLDVPITLENRFAVDYGRATNTRKFRLTDGPLLAEELREYKSAGGSVVVDLTVGGLGPDPLALRRIAQDAGVHVVLGCGHYVEAFQPPENHARNIDDFAEEMVEHVTRGAWQTSVRAGILGEIGCSQPWTDLERRVLRAAVEAQKATGAALNIHPGAAPQAPFEIVTFLKEAGADLERTIISHIDRTLFDVASMIRLADTGVVLEFDLFGYETTYWPFGDIYMPNDGQRLQSVRALADRGYLRQVLCSQDICRLTRLRAYGGHGYSHMLENVVPLMFARGFTAEEVDQIFVGNPRRLLAIPI